MKHFYRFCFVCFALLMANLASAAPGDSTFVQAHTSTQLSNFGNYDSPAAFPTGSTSYKKINMTFTLGKYQCPAGSQYCGDWDYTVQVFVITPTDTLEIGRLITPYAGISRFPLTWKHRYVFDVTDYATILKNNATVRIKYSGYSGGFTANVKFDFIEGTPPRNVIAIKKAWSGYFTYGNVANPIEAHLNNRAFQLPANAQSAALKLYLTGHGGNSNDGCAEFCQKYYMVKLNNAQISQNTIWRDNCGSNNLYPQTGTWVFDRANWCPGDIATPYVHTLNGLTPGSNFNLDVDFQPYSNANTQAGWQLEGQVIYYGAYNHTTDAALEKIISPSNHEAFYRDNQVCQEPKIEVKNNGSTTITSMEIQFGIANNPLNTYQWTGTMEAGEVTTIALPTVPEIQNVTAANIKFITKITKANGAPDAYALNNELQSTFTPLAIWPNKIVLTLNTNRARINGFNETSWKLYDANGTLVKQRINSPISSTLKDTLSLARGCYRLDVEDAGCDGVNWWYYQYYQTNPGTGSLEAQEVGKPAKFGIRGYFNGDFGCGFSHTFYVSTALGIKNEANAFSLNVFPNPASELLEVKLSEKVNPGNLKLINALGQVVYEAKTNASENRIPVKTYAPGVYVLTYQAGDLLMQKQVVITR